MLVIRFALIALVLIFCGCRQGEGESKSPFKVYHYKSVSEYELDSIPGEPLAYFVSTDTTGHLLFKDFNDTLHVCGFKIRYNPYRVELSSPVLYPIRFDASYDIWSWSLCSDSLYLFYFDSYRRRIKITGTRPNRIINQVVYNSDSLCGDEGVMYSGGVGDFLPRVGDIFALPNTPSKPKNASKSLIGYSISSDLRRLSCLQVQDSVFDSVTSGGKYGYLVKDTLFLANARYLYSVVDGKIIGKNPDLDQLICYRCFIGTDSVREMQYDLQNGTVTGVSRCNRGLDYVGILPRRHFGSARFVRIPYHYLARSQTLYLLDFDSNNSGADGLSSFLVGDKVFLFRYRNGRMVARLYEFEYTPTSLAEYLISKNLVRRITLEQYIDSLSRGYSAVVYFPYSSSCVGCRDGWLAKLRKSKKSIRIVFPQEDSILLRDKSGGREVVDSSNLIAERVGMAPNPTFYLRENEAIAYIKPKSVLDITQLIDSLSQ